AADSVPPRATSRRTRRSLHSAMALQICTILRRKVANRLRRPAASMPGRGGLVMSPRTPSSRWTLVAASFRLAMAILDAAAGNGAVPAIQSSLGSDVRGLSWVIDGYTLSFASLLLLAGGLGDRLGARRVFAAGLALFTVASVLCGAAPNLALLIVARVLQGAG